MGQRLQLQTILEQIQGVKKAYFQPPSNTQMQYPCIVYERDYAVTTYADNGPYHNTKRYSVTVIDRNPDSEIPDKVGALTLCRFNRRFTSDGLHHDVYNLYF